jgi:hypothetical protein
MFSLAPLSLASARALLPAAWKELVPSPATEVGWLVDTDHAGFIWDAPARVRIGTADGQRHAKSVAACPAVIDFEARHFAVPCPITARLKMTIDPNTGEAAVANAAGDQSPIRSKALGEMVKRVPAKEWRHPSRPVVQIVTPYVFLSDDPVTMSQTPPFNHFKPQPWPGLMIGGRFPIDVWPRHLMWAFEWHDVDRELVLTRGDPFFYVSFETGDASRQVRLVEAERTSELKEYMGGLSSVTNYVNRTFSLFATARARRPPALLVKKKKLGKFGRV